MCHVDLSVKHFLVLFLARIGLLLVLLDSLSEERGLDQGMLGVVFDLPFLVVVLHQLLLWQVVDNDRDHQRHHDSSDEHPEVLDEPAVIPCLD